MVWRGDIKNLDEDEKMQITKKEENITGWGIEIKNDTKEKKNKHDGLGTKGIPAKNNANTKSK